ncbi:MAG: SRPBCC family protein [Bacteroidales bacterium]|nr:SRPBCC family protein [Bacteroidales bacterium]
MSKVVSKIGKIYRNDDEIYNFLSDFRNLDSLVPANKITDWQSDEDRCRFSIAGIGATGMRIVEKEPYKLIKLGSYKESPVSFNIWIQLKKVEEGDTRIRLTGEAHMNSLMDKMVQSYLKKGLNSAVDRLTDFFNNKRDL